MLGFTRLLASVEDLALDFPDAAHTLSLFLGRAVVDEALPPSFLAAVLTSLRYDSLGVAVVHATGASSCRHDLHEAGMQCMTAFWRCTTIPWYLCFPVFSHARERSAVACKADTTELTRPSQPLLCASGWSSAMSAPNVSPTPVGGTRTRAVPVRVVADCA